MKENKELILNFLFTMIGIIIGVILIHLIKVDGLQNQVKELGMENQLLLEKSKPTLRKYGESRCECCERK